MYAQARQGQYSLCGSANMPRQNVLEKLNLCRWPRPYEQDSRPDRECSFGTSQESQLPNGNVLPTLYRDQS